MGGESYSQYYSLDMICPQKCMLKGLVDNGWALGKWFYPKGSGWIHGFCVGGALVKETRWGSGERNRSLGVCYEDRLHAHSYPPPCFPVTMKWAALPNHRLPQACSASPPAQTQWSQWPRDLRNHKAKEIVIPVMWFSQVCVTVATSFLKWLTSELLQLRHYFQITGFLSS